MLIRFLILSINFTILVNPVAAETVACTDSNGTLHIADNMMSLPKECRNASKPYESTGSGEVIYVPALPDNKNTRRDFERSVEQEERTQAQQRRQETNLFQRAESVANSYINAVAARKAAVRSKKYGTREQIQTADVIMQRSRNEKTALLQELKKARISQQKRQEIEVMLNKID